MSTRVNNLDGIASSGSVEYLDPLNPLTKPPLGVMVNVLTKGGTQTKAFWRDDGGFVGWFPLIKVPAWAKARIQEAYRAK